VKQVPLPETPKPEARHLDFATIERILAAMPERLSAKPGTDRGLSLAKLRARVLAYTGLPPGLLQKVTPAELVLVSPGAVRVRSRLKGAGVEARTVPLTAKGLDAFTAFHAANAYGAFSITALNRAFKRACTRAGLDRSTVTLYDLRHSFLTQLYKTTRDLATVGRFGLHAEGSSVTARYAQGANRDVDIAAAAAMNADLARSQQEALKAVPVQNRYRKLPAKVARVRKVS
jgi:integrase